MGKIGWIDRSYAAGTYQLVLFRFGSTDLTDGGEDDGADKCKVCGYFR